MMSNMKNVVQVNKVLVDRVRDLCRKAFTASAPAFRDIEAVLPPIDEEYVLGRLQHFAQQRGRNDKESEVFASKVWNTALTFPVEVGYFSSSYIDDDSERKAAVLAWLQSLQLRDLDAQLRTTAERYLDSEQRKAMNAALEQREEQQIKQMKELVQLKGVADRINMSVDDAARLALTKLTFASPPGGDGTRWTSKDVDAYLGTLNESESRSVLENAGNFVVKLFLHPESLTYAVIEISDLKSAAFRDLGGQSQIVSVLREVGHSMNGRMVDPVRFEDVPMELPVRDVNHNVVGRYTVMSSVKLEEARRNAPNKLFIAVNVDQAALLIPSKDEVKLIPPNGLLDHMLAQDVNRISPSVKALDRVDAVSHQFLLLGNDFAKMTPDHDLLKSSFKTACVEVTMPPEGLCNKVDEAAADSVFKDAKFVAVSGYTNGENLFFSDQIYCIGYSGGFDDLSEQDRAVKNVVQHFYKNREAFEERCNDKVFSVFTKVRDLSWSEVVQETITPSAQVY